MRRARNWLPALLLAALAATPRGAAAFALDLDGAGNVLHWVTGTQTSIPYQLARDNVPFGSAGENSIHRAFATWSAVSPTLEYRFDGYVDEPVMANDGRNVVLFVYEQWPFDPGFAAITFRYYDEEDGRLLDTDVAFNAESYAWSIGGSGFDIENSATHEVGHLSGLGHSDVEEATMFAGTLPGETAKRSLHADDHEGIHAIYGAHVAARPPAVVRPRVESGGFEGSFEPGAPSAGTLLVVAASLLALTARGLRRPPRNEPPVFELSRRRAARGARNDRCDRDGFGALPPGTEKIALGKPFAPSEDEDPPPARRRHAAPRHLVRSRRRDHAAAAHRARPRSGGGRRSGSPLGRPATDRTQELPRLLVGALARSVESVTAPDTPA